MAKKTVKKKRKQRVPRTRNANTMTEAQFWYMIRSALREKSRWWKPVGIARVKARRQYRGTNKKQRYEYQCRKCRKWFSDKEVQVDHIEAVGKLTGYEDLPGFVERLFCEDEGLQVLCSKCHDEKTERDNINIKKQ